MNEEEIILVGKIGLVVTSVLWLLATWRLGFHSECFGWHGREGADEEEQQQCACVAPFIKWITRRRAFHCLLWVATLFELLSYADLYLILPFTSDRILAENVGYALLNVGRSFELLAFCTATEIWLRTAIDARPRSMHSDIANQNFWLHWSTHVFVFFTALLILASASLSVVVFFRFPHAPNPEDVLIMPLSMLQTLLEAICWGMQFVMVVFSIKTTSRCILALVPSTDWKKRLYLLSKAVGPMIVSSLAYATRCGWLIAAYAKEIRFNSWAWWISFVWIPTAAVSIMLLYSTRKRDHDVEDIETSEDDFHDDGDDSLQQALLRPQPPEEAFRAFHNFRRGEEDADDSFSLGSPIPRAMPHNTLEVAVAEEA